MGLRPSINAEPIPGYQLLERLGAGGYGEVWKSSAPGGLFKAIKFIYGQLDDSRAGQEAKALNRIKSVRHPFLLTLERVEVIDGQLVVVTELADETLGDRYAAYRAQNLPGIPREKLLEYMRDTADALDFMTEKFGLQHLDIKPANLLLVGDRVKVADFGLVKDIQGDNVTATGGVSPAYAACEFFDGRISRYSDQYSLAIVYAEMLTGIRPFPGTTAVQLAMQHSTGRPMLDPLPLADRPIIARALSKDPSERYPSCRELVRALEAATHGQQSAVEALKVVPTPTPESESDEDLDTELPGELSGGDSSPEQTAQLQTMAAPLLSLSQFADDQGDAEVTRIRPTLFIGIGGMGVSTLKHLRRRMSEAYDSWSMLPMIRTLIIDTDRKEVRAATEGGVEERIPPEDAVLIPLQRSEHYKPNSKEILRWMDRRWYFGMPRSQETEGIRALGRLALIDNIDKVRGAIRDALVAIASSELDSVHTAPRSKESPQVVLVGSIAGGSASGTFVDLIHEIRAILEDLQWPTDVISTRFLHATSPKPSEMELSRANAYAAMLELNRLLRPELNYPGEPMTGMESRNPQGPLLKECYVVHLGDGLSRDEAHSATDIVAEYMFLETATGWGKLLAHHRSESAGPAAAGATDPTIRSVGLYRLRFRQQELAAAVSRIASRQLLARWHGDLAFAVEAEQGAMESSANRSCRLKEMGENESLAILSKLDLDPERIRLMVESSTVSAGDAESEIEKVAVQKVQEILDRDGSVKAQELAANVVRDLDQLVGSGPIMKDARRAVKSPFELKLSEVALQYGVEQADLLSQLIGAIVCDSTLRFKPALIAIDGVLHHLLTRLEQMNRQQMQAEEYREGLRSRLAGQKPTETLVRKGLFQKSLNHADLAELSAKYLRSRLDELTLGAVTATYRVLYKRATDIRGKLVEARQHSSALMEQLGQEADDGRHGPPSRCLNGIDLLPAKSASISEASVILAKTLSTTSFFDDMDDRFEEMIADKLGGMWSVLNNATASFDKVVRAELPAVSLAASMAYLANVDAASLFFERQPALTDTIREIKRIVEKSRPRLTEAGGKQRLILGVPKSPPGRSLRELIMAQLPAHAMTAVANDRDVVFCFETSHLTITSAAEEIIGHQAAFVQVGSMLVTRTDLPLDRLKHDIQPAQRS